MGGKNGGSDEVTEEAIAWSEESELDEAYLRSRWWRLAVGVRGDVSHAAAPRVMDPRVGRPLSVGECLDLTRVEVMVQDRAEVAGDIGDDLPPLEGGFSACLSQRPYNKNMKTLKIGTTTGRVQSGN